MRALDLSQTTQFTFPTDTDIPPTRFELGVLDTFIRAKIDDAQTEYQYATKDNLDEKADFVVHRHQRNIDVVRFGLKGWTGFKTVKGEEVRFDTVASSRWAEDGKPRNVVSDQLLRQIPPEIIDGLAEEIMRVNRLSEQDIKNS